MKTFKEVLEIIRGSIKENHTNLDENTPLTGIKDNSKDIREGDVFVAIPGHKVDGHNFIPAAVDHKATLVIAQDDSKLPDNRNFNYIIVDDSRKVLADLAFSFFGITNNTFHTFAVTGTNGKSTSVSLLHHILRESKKPSTLMSTVEIKLNDELVEEPYNTTQGIIKTAEILKSSADKGIKNINFEVSSHAIDQKRIENFKFDIISFTNITRDHLDYHSSFEEYESIKLSLVEFLKPNGIAIVNIDAISLDKINLPRERIITYGKSDEADYKIKDIICNIYQMNFKLETPDGNEIPIYTSILGEFNAYNIANVVIAAKLMGVTDEEIKHAVITFKGVPGRFQLVHTSKSLGFSVVVDFAHTPDALEKVLRTAKTIVRGRVISVFGAGGSADIGKRRLMGEVASKFADIIVLTNDDPKDDDPDQIIEDIKQGIDINKNFIVIMDRRTAIDAAINFASKDDIVVIAGRGHEKFQLFSNGKKVKFNDFEVATELVENLKRSIKK